MGIIKKYSRKVLIASGDSWTAGSYRQKLDSFPYWPEILADKLDMNFINVGLGGKGNEFIYARMIDKLCETKKIGLSVCLWSHVDRWDLWRCTFPINPKYRNNINDWRYYERHNKFIDALHEHGDLVDGGYNLLKSIRWYHAFQNHCELQNIPYLQMQAFNSGPDMFRKELFDSRQFDFIKDNKFVGWPMYRQLGGSTMWDELDDVDPEQVKLRVSKEDLHPNREGHEYMAEILYDKYMEIYK